MDAPENAARKGAQKVGPQVASGGQGGKGGRAAERPMAARRKAGLMAWLG
jgi:hypothetical protein